jgi:hypothetical protein
MGAKGRRIGLPNDYKDPDDITNFELINAEKMLRERDDKYDKFCRHQKAAQSALVNPFKRRRASRPGKSDSSRKA